MYLHPTLPGSADRQTDSSRAPHILLNPAWRLVHTGVVAPMPTLSEKHNHSFWREGKIYPSELFPIM